jgi:hypothetical protein
VSKKEEKKVLDEADEEKIFEDTIRVFNKGVEAKRLTRDQHRQAVKEHIAILRKVINYHKGRLKRMKYKYRG